MTNPWISHVKNTMDIMKVNGNSVAFKKVLIAAKKTYKKAGTLKSIKHKKTGTLKRKKHIKHKKRKNT